MGENHFERWPTILYGVNLLLCALAFSILKVSLIRHQGRDSLLARALSKDFKGRASPLLYVAGIASAYVFAAWVGTLFFVGVALMWLIPDRRLEKAIAKH
jgi:uncharacterized membrane protein